MSAFVGRDAEFERLGKLLDQVRAGGDEPGRAISIRGRRRVGKSRLVREFIKRSGVPHVYFDAEHAGTSREIARFEREVHDSDLPDRDLYSAGPDWSSALRGLATVLPREVPSVVVIDEVPYLTRDDRSFEGALQGAWDRALSALPVLLILIGSNQSEMERLTSYDRPFYQRGTEMEVGPLTVNDVAELTGLAAVEAIDAYLVTGGMPMILRDYPHGLPVAAFLTEALANPLSSLIVSGERTLGAELPVEAHARTALAAIGHGEASFTRIANRAELGATQLDRALKILIERRLVCVEHPLAMTLAKNARYRVADSYLRFWLRFLSGRVHLVEAGRPELLIDDVLAHFGAWRGRAVEPILRDLLWKSRGLVPDVGVVGGWWNRTNSTEVDLVGADRLAPARSVEFVGSIKWRAREPFGVADLAALDKARLVVPGADQASLVAISATGYDVTASELTAITAEQLLASIAGDFGL